MNAFYITTPIYYVNGKPHLGHSYTSVLADMLTRFHALLGEKVFYLTGTDEHGDKIVRTAEKEGVTPKALADKFSDEFKKMWNILDVQYSHFIRTTDVEHKNVVQHILQKIYDKGDIYFGEYGGHYCYGCERFYAEKELEDGICPQHKTKPEYVKEKNYFFKMKQYLPWLKEYLEQHPELIQPSQYRKEIVAILEQEELEDLCISRPKSRLSWGIELPFDTEYVCYVWFDALINYISGIGYPNAPDFELFWSNAEHIIAKDIVKPHAIFWPCMLHSADIPLFKTLHVHGYWLARETKLSKSLGNAVDPVVLIQQYGVDALRYFLLRDMHFGSDATFSITLFSQRIISDLANDVGNLFSRSLAMAQKYCNSSVPQFGTYEEIDILLHNTIKKHIHSYIEHCKNVAPAKAFEHAIAIASSINKYIDDVAPWALHKNNDTQRLHTVLYCIFEGLRKLTITLTPAMPSTAKTMFRLLGLSSENISLIGEDSDWGKLEVGSCLGASVALFPRSEWERIAENAKKDTEEAIATTATNKPAREGELFSIKNIDFEHFSALDLRVGTVLEATMVEDTNTLLLLRVDIGEKEPRQILSAIANHYEPKDIIAKKVVVVANLAPKTIRNIESQGMILTIKEGTDILLLKPPTASTNGSKIV